MAGAGTPSNPAGEMRHVPGAVPRVLMAALVAAVAVPVGAQVIWTSPPGRHTASVNSVAISADGRLVASGSQDATVKLWDVATGAEVRTIEHGHWVEAVAFSPDSLHVASGGWDDTVRLWQIATGAEVQQFAAGVPVQTLAFSPDGTLLVAAGARGTILMWDAASGDEVRQFSGHEGWVQSVAFSPDGAFMVSGGGDETARLWDPGTGAQVRQFSDHTSEVLSVAISPDGSQVASAAEYPDDTIRLWDATTASEEALIAVFGNPSSMAYSPDGKYLASGANDFSVQLWDLATGAEIAGFVGDDFEINTVAMSRDGKYLASAWDGYTVRLWDVAAMLEGGSGAALALDGSVDHQTFTQGVDIGLLVLPEAKGGTAPYTYTLEPALPPGLIFDAAGRTISGIPTAPSGSTIYLYTARDANESTAAQSFALAVVAEVSFSDMIPDQAFPRAQPIAPLVLPRAAGGLAPVAYTLDPALPEGLDFDAASRTMTGTPTMVTSGPSAYTYKAAGANGSSDSLMFGIEVYSPVSAEPEAMPDRFTMHGSYPNPFRDRTRIVFDLPWPARVRAEVLDIAGRRVGSIPGTDLGAGWDRRIEVSGAGLPSGPYLYRVYVSSPAGSTVHGGLFVRIR